MTDVLIRRGDSDTDTEEDYVKTRRRQPPAKLRREASEETKPADTLILDV